MRRSVSLWLWAQALCCVCSALLLWSCGGGSHSAGTLPTGSTNIQHVIILVQENRTPDNLFHNPVLISRGADLADSGTNSNGQTIPLQALPLVSNVDLAHDHGAFFQMYNSGQMNGANLVGVACSANCPSNPQFSYVRASDVQPYFQLAEQYTFADRMFQTNEGPSFPSHQIIFSGTSAPSSGSNLQADADPPSDPTGCLAPPGETLATVAPDGTAGPAVSPCFDHPTLTDQLNQAGVSWRYYTPSAGSHWTAPNAISHICQPQTVNGTPTCTGADWKNVIIPSAQILSDIANQSLPQVSWVIPQGPASDHPAENDGSGPSWVSSIVNAVGQSPYWSNTVIFVTWDDWGGWFDQVAPTVVHDGSTWGSGDAYGFRVPLRVVSSFAKPAYVSHTLLDFGSILKFVEEAFHLPSLNYADAHADDLSDCFDFSQTPIASHAIEAPLKADFFLKKENQSTH